MFVTEGAIFLLHNFLQLYLAFLIGLVKRKFLSFLDLKMFLLSFLKDIFT